MSLSPISAAVTFQPKPLLHPRLSPHSPDPFITEMDSIGVLLNDDVLRQIFTFVCQQQRYPVVASEPYNSSRLTLPRSLAPWNTAAVCKQFRRIMCGSPSLWTRFEFCTRPCSRGTTCRHNLDFTRCQLQLERSQSLPHTLFLSRAGHCEPVKSLIRTLGSQMHRWENLFLYLPEMHMTGTSMEDHTSFFDLLPPYPLNLSLLRQMEYCDSARAGQGISLWSELDAASLPSLVVLKVTDNAQRFFQAGRKRYANFPLSQLQELSVETNFSSPVELTRMLEQCTSLGSLTVIVSLDLFDIDDEWDSEVLEQTRGSVVLRNLTTLVVGLPWDQGPGVLQIMCHLSMPGLQNLMIISGRSSSDIWNKPVDMETFSTIFSHWNPTVRCLELEWPHHTQGFSGVCRSFPIRVPAFLDLRAFEELEELVLYNEHSRTGDTLIQMDKIGPSQLGASKLISAGTPTLSLTLSLATPQPRGSLPLAMISWNGCFTRQTSGHFSSPNSRYCESSTLGSILMYFSRSSKTSQTPVQVRHMVYLHCAE